MSASTVVVLGPQRLSPTLRDAVAELPGFDLAGAHYAVVTAGWEEREGEHRELAEHLGGHTTNLDLRDRAEDVFRRDPEFFQAFLAHNGQRKQVQEFYRVRLAHQLDAARELLTRNRAHDDPELIAQAQEQAIEDVRQLDTQHTEDLRELQQKFEQTWQPLERDAVAEHRLELSRIVGDSSALCVAGGHVVILLNRLRLFGVVPMVGPRPIVCWSAGAMALSERVVVFHDHPPQGAGNAEVLEVGLGVFRGLVPLPHARRRLRLDDPVRVGLFARRFGPAMCAVLEQGTRVDWDGEHWSAGAGTERLMENGEVEEIVGGDV